MHVYIKKTNKSYLEQLVEGLKDEKKRDEGSEDVLGELGEVLDQRGALSSSWISIGRTFG